MSDTFLIGDTFLEKTEASPACFKQWKKIVIKHNTGIVIINKALSGDDGIMFVPVCNSFWLL